VAWHLTLLAVHIAALVGAGYLYRSAPCWMQKLTVLGIVVAMLVISVAYALAVLDVWGWWLVVVVGLSIEHLAVLLYVFRLIYKGNQWKPSSAHSLSS
jgi:hypothetical protein